jgi:hypothetical protein
MLGFDAATGISSTSGIRTRANNSRLAPEAFPITHTSRTMHTYHIYHTSHTFTTYHTKHPRKGANWGIDNHM